MIKFTDLKNEILYSLSQPKQSIELTEELYSSCEKYAKVKELFWKVNSRILSDELILNSQSSRILIYLFTMWHNFALVHNR